MRNYIITIIAVISLFGLSACDTGYQTLEPGEYGVEFVKLPTFLGGGVKSTVLVPGPAVLVMPWEELYKIDTTVQTISWGEHKDMQSGKKFDDAVQTRTVDGNEVLLSLTVHYHIDPTKVAHIIQYVSGDKTKMKQRIHELVSAVARADIRTHLNTLSTRDFFRQEKRQEGLDRTKVAMNARLNAEGIIIDAVNYKGHRFERVKKDSIDDSYQQKIDQTQATNQETEQEKKRIASVIEQKKIEFNEALAKVNRANEEARGRKDQATLRGNSYLKAKTLEADRIKAVGAENLEGLRKRTEALSGPGGEAILKMEIAEQLIKANPKFVVINDSSGLSVQKLDTNDLLKQLGVIEALKDKPLVEEKNTKNTSDVLPAESNNTQKD